MFQTVEQSMEKVSFEIVKRGRMLVKSERGELFGTIIIALIIVLACILLWKWLGPFLTQFMENIGNKANSIS